MKNEKLGYKLRSIMQKILRYLEIILGLAVIVYIVYETFLAIGYPRQPISEYFLDYLQKIATIIIGIEFVKLIFSHSLKDVVDVMVMAIVRQMIVSHSSTVDNIICTVAIAVLFAVRKYLFVEKLDEE